MNWESIHWFLLLSFDAVVRSKWQVYIFPLTKVGGFDDTYAMITLLTRTKSKMGCEELSFIKSESLVKTMFTNTLTIMHPIEMPLYV